MRGLTVSKGVRNEDILDEVRAARRSQVSGRRSGLEPEPPVWEWQESRISEGGPVRAGGGWWSKLLLGDRLEKNAHVSPPQLTTVRGEEGQVTNQEFCLAG